MKSTVLHKSSSVANRLPQPSDLKYGEIAINYSKGSECISIKNHRDEIASLYFEEGINAVTTLQNTPTDKRLVYATVNTNQILSFKSLKSNVKVKIIVYNTSTSTLEVVLPFSDYICFDKCLKIPVNGYGIITVDSNNDEVFIDGKVQERADGYQGGEATIALSNGTDYVFVKNKNLKKFKSDSSHSAYAPIGIVLIPASHTQVILPDGDPRKGKTIIMSLKPMNYTTPDTGGISEQSMYWGPTTAVTGLTNFNVVNKLNSFTDQTLGATNSYCYLPSDKFTNAANKCEACPTNNYYSQSPLAPSPYKVVDGEWLPNEDYYTTRISNFNALSDFNGPENTKLILDDVNLGEGVDWKTLSSITNSYDAGNHPAACCCARFNAPKGTKSFATALSEGDEHYKDSGVWYMPACGELGYFLANFTANNTALSNIRSLYGTSTAVLLYTGSGYWSSSQYSATNARNVYTYDGGVGYGSKNANYYVRAVCAV